MQAEAQRLKRFRRLERVRAIARQTAAAESAQAESTLAQLEALAGRTRNLAAGYAGSPADAHTLIQQARFINGLVQIAVKTEGDAAQARVLADRRQTDLAQAERSRAVVDEKARDTERLIAKTRSIQALGGRKGQIGTDLE